MIVEKKKFARDVYFPQHKVVRRHGKSKGLWGKKIKKDSGRKEHLLG